MPDMDAQDWFSLVAGLAPLLCSGVCGSATWSSLATLGGFIALYSLLQHGKHCWQWMSSSIQVTLLPNLLMLSATLGDRVTCCGARHVALASCIWCFERPLQDVPPAYPLLLQLVGTALSVCGTGAARREDGGAVLLALLGCFVPCACLLGWLHPARHDSAAIVTQQLIKLQDTQPDVLYSSNCSSRAASTSQHPGHARPAKSDSFTSLLSRYSVAGLLSARNSAAGQHPQDTAGSFQLETSRKLDRTTRPPVRDVMVQLPVSLLQQLEQRLLLQETELSQFRQAHTSADNHTVPPIPDTAAAACLAIHQSQAQVVPGSAPVKGEDSTPSQGNSQVPNKQQQALTRHRGVRRAQTVGAIWEGREAGLILDTITEATAEGMPSPAGSPRPSDFLGMSMQQEHMPTALRVAVQSHISMTPSATKRATRRTHSFTEGLKHAAASSNTAAALQALLPHQKEALQMAGTGVSILVAPSRQRVCRSSSRTPMTQTSASHAASHSDERGAAAADTEVSEAGGTHAADSSYPGISTAASGNSSSSYTPHHALLQVQQQQQECSLQVTRAQATEAAAKTMFPTRPRLQFSAVQSCDATSASRHRLAFSEVRPGSPRRTSQHQLDALLPAQSQEPPNTGGSSDYAHNDGMPDQLHNGRHGQGLAHAQLQLELEGDPATTQLCCNTSDSETTSPTTSHQFRTSQTYNRVSFSFDLTAGESPSRPAPLPRLARLQPAQLPQPGGPRRSSFSFQAASAQTASVSRAEPHSIPEEGSEFEESAHAQELHTGSGIIHSPDTGSGGLEAVLYDDGSEHDDQSTADNPDCLATLGSCIMSAAASSTADHYVRTASFGRQQGSFSSRSRGLALLRSSQVFNLDGGDSGSQDWESGSVGVPSLAGPSLSGTKRLLGSVGMASLQGWSAEQQLLSSLPHNSLQPSSQRPVVALKSPLARAPVNPVDSDEEVADLAEALGLGPTLQQEPSSRALLHSSSLPAGRVPTREDSFKFMPAAPTPPLPMLGSAHRAPTIPIGSPDSASSGLTSTEAAHSDIAHAHSFPPPHASSVVLLPPAIGSTSGSRDGDVRLAHSKSTDDDGATLAALRKAQFSNASIYKGRYSNLLTLDNAIPENATFSAGGVLLQQMMTSRSGRFSNITSGSLDAPLDGRQSSTSGDHGSSTGQFSMLQGGKDTSSLDAGAGESSAQFLPAAQGPVTWEGFTARGRGRLRGGAGVDRQPEGPDQLSQHSSMSQVDGGDGVVVDPELVGLMGALDGTATSRSRTRPSSRPASSSPDRDDVTGMAALDQDAPTPSRLHLITEASLSQLSRQADEQGLPHMDTVAQWVGSVRGRMTSTDGSLRPPAAGSPQLPLRAGNTSRHSVMSKVSRDQHHRDHPSVARFLPAPSHNFSHSTGQAGPRMPGQGDSVEIEIEDAIVLNRRLLDAKRVLLAEVKIEKVLGFGSMGMVYFGRLWDRKVVVKLIEHGTGLMGKEQNRGKLARMEAIVSRMLLHPHVVVTYDACTGPMDANRLKVQATPGRGMRAAAKAGRQRQMTMMVQEFCEGGTLKDALGKAKWGLVRDDPGYPRLLLQLALDIAQGMRYMHSLRVLHLDLKAENVLLQAAHTQQEDRVGNLVAKVADFGLAMVLPPDAEFKEKGIHGTVSHMPPEAMRETVFSFGTDVYSFGVVLWELITQDKPFPHMAAHQVVEAVCDRQERPPWPDTLPEPLLSLKDLACECWQTSPAHRPSFAEVVERVQAMIRPKASVPSRNASQRSVTSTVKSDGTDVSDELELALKAQRKQAAAAAKAAGSKPPMQAVPSLLSQRGEQQGVEAEPEAPLGEARESGASQLQRPSDTGSAMGLRLADVLAGPPPKDPLGRMLYFLAQPPPPMERLHRVQVEPGILRLVLSVDMGRSGGIAPHLAAWPSVTVQG